MRLFSNTHCAIPLPFPLSNFPSGAANGEKSFNNNLLLGAYAYEPGGWGLQPPGSGNNGVMENAGLENDGPTKINGVENARLENDGLKNRAGNCRTGIWRTGEQGWKMQDWKMQD